MHVADCVGVHEEGLAVVLGDHVEDDAGDENAVSSAVRNQIESAGISTVRLGGQTRYDTSVKVADWVTSYCGFSSKSISFATGGNYADALAGTSFAGYLLSPLLLVKDSTSPTISWARGKRPELTCLLGGTGVISPQTAEAIAKTMN